MQTRERLVETLTATGLPALVPPMLASLASTWRVSVLGLDHAGIGGCLQKSSHARSYLVRCCRHPRWDSVVVDCDKSDRRRIFAFWHGRMLGLSAALPEAIRCHSLVFLVAPLPEARFFASSLSSIGARTIQATNPGTALIKLAREVRRGASLCLAVDGPQGPAFAARSGASMVSRLTGVPVVPLGARCSPTLRIPGWWDQFLVPPPGAAVVIEAGAPIPAPGCRRDVAEHVRALQVQLDRLNETSSGGP